MSKRLNVLVTGSSSGFGRLIVQKLAQEKHYVFASMRDIDGKNAAAAQQLREWAAAERAALQIIEMDVTLESSVSNAIDQVIADAGRIDVVINNAGVGAFGINEGFTTVQLRDLFDVNVLSVHRVNRAVLPHMRAQKSGLIVYISSALGRFIVPTMGVYSAAKFAMEALAESYHYSLAALGIDSVILEPTGYLTDGFYTKGQLPTDEDRVTAYGPVAATLQGLGEGYVRSLQGIGAPNPQEVADIIAQIVKTPAGQRPLRITVGRGSEGAGAINTTTDQVQTQLFEMFGIQHLLTVAVDE